MNHEHLEEFGGLPVFDFPGRPAGSGPAGESLALPEADSVAWRLAVDWDSEVPWVDEFDRFLETVDSTRVRAVVVGTWVHGEGDGFDPVDEVLAKLVSVRDRFPGLRSVFLGDITQEENEISWITQGRVTDLLDAYPELTEFTVRGSAELRFPAIRHERLEKFTIQTGGLPAEVARGVAASELPALTHLELWLGTPNYDGDTEIADLVPILAGDRLPELRHLALRNSEIQDEVCAALAAAPVVARLESLDVSMGILTDAGAAALLSGQPLNHLKRLDMHYNYLSPEMCARLSATLSPGVELDLDSGDAESYTFGGEEIRYVSVGE